jgi:hypothetical protein
VERELTALVGGAAEAEGEVSDSDSALAETGPREGRGRRGSPERTPS